MTERKEKPPLRPEICDMLERFAAQLSAAGMKEPTRPCYDLDRQRRFYRETTELTAFVVNLHGGESGVEVVCGYASTAFTRMKNDENALLWRGVDDESINIRERFVVRDSADEVAAFEAISAMYEAYRAVEKDELLRLAKEKRKQWLELFAVRLKPLGFRKKGNMWTRQLEEGYLLRFEAQKSAYADSYYFNIFIGREESRSLGECYDKRVSPTKDYPADWQLLSEDVWVRFAEDVVENHLLPVINAPLSELGKQPDVWEKCHCNRDKCPVCWVEKNCWEATGAPRPSKNPWRQLLGCENVTAVINGQLVKLSAEQIAELAKED